MNVNLLCGFRGVARSFMNEICIFAPGSCIPACHAKDGWRSRKSALGGELEDASGDSARAIAIAKDAGPKPIQIKSSGESFGDVGVGSCLHKVSKRVQ